MVIEELTSDIEVEKRGENAAHADRQPATMPAEIAAVEELEHARSECARLRRVKDWGKDLRAAEIRVQECVRRLCAARRLHAARLLNGGICPERDRLLGMVTSCVLAHSQMVRRAVSASLVGVCRFRGEIEVSQNVVINVSDMYREHLREHGCGYLVSRDALDNGKLQGHHTEANDETT
jgi:hypothetical protein